MIVSSTQKSPKKRSKIHTWLRKRISSLDFGFKHEGRPIHCNTNSDILDKLNNHGWLDRLKNRDLDDHFDGSRTYYFAGNGSSKFDETLVMIDIDCHAKGTTDGAFAFAESLRADPLFGNNLYVESSTNGVGRHGYLVVVKGWARDGVTNVALKILDLYLKVLCTLGNSDIELVEIKGTCPELTWGLKRGRLEKYQSGQLAKLPRDASSRADELMGTSQVHVSRLLRLGFDLADKAEIDGVSTEIVHRIRTASEHLFGRRPRPEHLEQLRQGVKEWAQWRASRAIKLAVPSETLTFASNKAGERRVNTKPARGSTQAPTVSDEIARQIHTKLMRFARNWCNGGLDAGMRRRVIPMDVATLIAILAHTKDHPNGDGSTPTAWIRMLWEDLHDRGHIDRPLDHHRYRAAREFLSRMGWIAWQDENYVVGEEINGAYRKGQAARWEASDYLRGIVEEVEEAGSGDDRNDDMRGRYIYGHNNICFDILTVPEYLRDEIQYWKSPRFAGYVGQTMRMVA